ncbi:MAG TPA: glycoside hydrolase family 5 protein [Patescibacteria group bacterium]|nr:glycoside hydrolase family 5 protein [Patescibacteria group bacterium]
MKNSFLLCCFGLLVAQLGFSQPPTQNPADAFEQNHRLGRGVNILGYDPIWRERDQARFKEKHFVLLKEAGFNSVRVNLHPFAFMSATNNWRLPESWIQVLNWVLVNADKQGLAVILDLHEYGVMGDDPAANQIRFLSFWRQIAQRYRGSPSSVMFELLNEPSHNMTPELWNGYLKDALAIIRESAPQKTVIVGPAFWNSIDHLKELELPDDSNLIVTVHYYQPMDFTHQGAPWADRKDKLGVSWKGAKKELQAIDRDFDKAVSWAQEHHRPIFLGEFGSYDKAPMDSRARYTAAVARGAEKRGWSWAYWQFDSDFILYDMTKDVWVNSILKALIPVAAAPKQVR